jgi:hypothetical protein
VEGVAGVLGFGDESVDVRGLGVQDGTARL